MISRGATTSRDAFISHSSADHARWREGSSERSAPPASTWLDDSDIRSGVMLGAELPSAILGCRVLVLLWSENAAKSRWGNSEWLLALHQGRFIVPCALDETPLPQGLANDVFLKLPDVRKEAVARLVRDIEGAGERRFFETLASDPTDPSALNGLGNVLFLNRDLNAAEFSHRAAIAAAGGSYPAGEHDLELVLWYRRDMAAVSDAIGDGAARSDPKSR